MAVENGGGRTWNAALQMPICRAASNAFGFGGHNACRLLQKV